MTRQTAKHIRLFLSGFFTLIKQDVAQMENAFDLLSGHEVVVLPLWSYTIVWYTYT